LLSGATGKVQTEAATTEEDAVGRLSTVFGLIALAIILAVAGLAFTALKWLLVAAAIVFLLGVLRAFVSSRDGSGPSGPDAR
jgi:hypothetical protein